MRGSLILLFSSSTWFMTGGEVSTNRAWEVLQLQPSELSDALTAGEGHFIIYFKNAVIQTFKLSSII